jgi:hypothetical protein
VKIAVFGCAIDKDEGETKGTFVLNTAEEVIYLTFFLITWLIFLFS